MVLGGFRSFHVLVTTMNEHNMYETCTHELNHVSGAVWKSQIGLKNHMEWLFLQTVDCRFSFSPTFFCLLAHCSKLISINSPR